MLLAAAPLALAALIVDGPAPGDFSLAFWATALYIGVFATAFAFWAVVEATRRLSAATTSNAMLAVPVVGLTFSGLRHRGEDGSLAHRRNGDDAGRHRSRRLREAAVTPARRRGAVRTTQSGKSRRIQRPFERGAIHVVRGARGDDDRRTCVKRRLRHRRCGSHEKRMAMSLCRPASLQAGEKLAPLNPGIKHLASDNTCNKCENHERHEHNSRHDN